MKIRSIKIEDWRQFYGEQSLCLSTSDKKNVTLIHAANGVGKTTILNAILWCFYETTTSRFEKAKSLINNEAVKERKKKASIEVELMHADAQFRILRRVLDKRGSGAGPRFKKDWDFSAYAVENGISRALDAPKSFINSVVPEEMAPYFFFDGEAAETFSAEGDKKATEEAIKNILGCNLLEDAIKDLSYWVKRDRKEMGDLPGQDEVRSLADRYDEVEVQIEKWRAEKKECQDKYNTAVKQINVLEDALRKNENAAAIQEMRDTQSSILEDKKTQDDDLLSQKVTWLREFLAPMLAHEKLIRLQSLLESESRSGRIPSPYNEEFVRSLLNARSCVCGRSLEPGTNEFNAVAKLTGDAGDSTVQRRIVAVQAFIRSFSQGTEGAMDKYKEIERKIAKVSDAITAAEQKITDCKEKLKGIDVKEIKEKEAKRAEWDRLRDEASKKIGILDSNIERFKIEADQIKSNIRRVAAKSRQLSPIQARIRLAEAAQERLESIANEHIESARKSVEKNINDILDETTRRAYQAQINSDFSMELHHEGTVTAKSSGENQLLSLAFMSALIKFARTRQGQTAGGYLIPGTVAPLVLDSPFGQLDPHYRRSTARFISELSDQVVLLLSESQASGDVLEEIEPYVGKEYVLVAHNREERRARPEDTIVFQGERIPTTIYDSDRTYTEILELR
ncbi:DNA sulfur modification protein DndD [Natronospira proteinivora]|uniref:DNA sulfur modification protein DndD n=1 Tax=Natronospira proteinivora TaxID=1807133 RepID=A0ABT1G9A3_9GAMM|nr:AAA family ATPase [Natronospira proteinivora]MCP1727617.1 DNA sulfur modification protein DndD [Natronospira proteinivora]